MLQEVQGLKADLSFGIPTLPPVKTLRPIYARMHNTECVRSTLIYTTLECQEWNQGSVNLPRSVNTNKSELGTGAESLSRGH